MPGRLGRIAQLLPTTGARAVLVIGVVTAFVSCDTFDADNVLRVEATGLVRGFGYRDENGSGEFDNGRDTPFENLPVELLLSGTSEVIGTATTSQGGLFVIPDVPVGRVELRPDDRFLSDSLSVVELDSMSFTVAAADSVTVRFGLSFPRLTVEEVRGLDAGQTVFTEGIILNSPGSFTDRAVHLASEGYAIRALNLSSTSVFPGDSVRLQGLTAQSDGQPVLDQVGPLLLSAFGTVPDPVSVTTAAATTADGGRLDAMFVVVEDITVADTMSSDNHLVVTVDDDSGPLEVFVDDGSGIQFSGLIPNAKIVELRGILVPIDPGPMGPRWQLRPRFSADVELQQVGSVRGFVYFDEDGSETEQVGEPGFGGLAVSLRSVETLETVASATSSSEGEFEFEQVPVGTYRMLVDTMSATLGDSLRVVEADTAEFFIPDAGSVPQTIGVGYPRLTIAEARAASAGRKVWVSGLAMNNPVTFGDFTLHLWNARDTVAIRTTNVLPFNINPPDTVRLLGRTSATDGQPTLDQVDQLRNFGNPQLQFPPPVVSAMDAATAKGGALDAVPVLLRDATIVSTETDGNGDFLVTLTDVSDGEVVMVLDVDITFNLARYTPDLVIDVTGLLVPASPVENPLRWVVKPRAPNDVQF